jgi:1-acyl-sn-glycerol-3-phosphate acyltransferase
MFEQFMKGLTAAFFAVFYRVEIKGIENVPQEGAAILCANHIGQLDMFFFGYKLKRMIHYMSKEELFRVPLLGAFIKRLGAFPIRRGTGDVHAIKTALKLLEEGHIMGIFPEGTRSKNKSGKKGKAKPGVALLAQKSGKPIIPVAISGSRKPLSKIKVVFGKPFALDLDKNKKYTNSELVSASEEVMKKIYSLLEEE